MLERLLERAQGFVRPLGARPPISTALAGRHCRQPLHRALHAHARVLRARREAARRRRRQPRSAALLARQGREHARHGLHAAVAARRRLRDPRRRSRACPPSWRRTSPRTSACSPPAKRTCRIRRRACSMRSPCASTSSASTGLSIAIVGDIRHSRVARSAYHVFRTLGVPDLRIVAPPALMPAAEEFAGCARHTSLEAGLEGRRRRDDAAHPEGAHGPGRPAGRGPLLRRSTA